MKIDNNYHIKKRPLYAALVKTEQCKRKKDKKGKWSKGDIYQSSITNYYGTMKKALLGYFTESMGEAKEIKDILDTIQESEQRIKEFVYKSCI